MLTAERLRALLSYDPATGAFTWRVKRRGQSPVGSVAGTLGNHGYWQIQISGRVYLGHRLAWLHAHGRWPAKLIDHRNTVRTDNRLDNLREADRSTNAANAKAHADSATGLKGAHPYRNKFKAEIYARGRRRHIGVFDTAEQAHAAYCAAAKELFGEFARSA